MSFTSGSSESQEKSYAEARRRLVDVGPNEIPEARQHRFRDFASKFWGPVAWMLEAALGLDRSHIYDTIESVEFLRVSSRALSET